MKKIIFLLLITITYSNIYSQSIELEKVIQVDSSLSKETLFNRLSTRLIEFIGTQDKYNKAIIQSDKELGIIKFKQQMRYSPGGGRSDAGYINYVVNVFFKDGRFKIIISDVNHAGIGISLYTITEDSEYPHKKSNWLKFRKKAWIKVKEHVNNELPKVIPIIEGLILKPTELEKDW